MLKIKIEKKNPDLHNLNEYANFASQFIRPKYARESK
jgi:hypothetical protein